jgi:hypothetical protein
VDRDADAIERATNEVPSGTFLVLDQRQLESLSAELTPP